MLKDEELRILEFLTETCGKEYKLISTLAFRQVLSLSEEEDETVEKILKNLDERGYADIKYYSSGEFLIKPLPLGFSAVKEDKPLEQLPPTEIPVITKKDKIHMFFMGFLGGLTGSLVVGIISVLC